MKDDYLEWFKRAGELKVITKHWKPKILEEYYGDEEIKDIQSYYRPMFQEFLADIRGLILTLSLLGFPRTKKALEERYRNLDDWSNLKKRKVFEEKLEDINKILDANVEEKAEKRLSLLDSIQIERLDEAIHCLKENCFYSSIIMAVSSLEFSLLKLLKEDEKLKEEFETPFKSEVKEVVEKMYPICKNCDNVEPIDNSKPIEILRKSTKKGSSKQPSLGALISFFLKKVKMKELSDVKYKYLRNHEFLLSLCNQYRISSAHPTGGKANERIAVSILNLTFEFLLGAEEPKTPVIPE